ncbi:MAG TPA: hypothetical protein VF730_12665 [Terracidiphilus sp.]
MRKIVVLCSLLMLVPVLGPKAGAQDKTEKAPSAAAPAGPVHYYHFDFVVEDLDAAGKVVNSRSYSTTVDTEPHYLTSLRAGSKIPVITGTVAGNTQYQYIDLGVDLDLRDVHEVGQQLALDLTANLSGESSPSDPNFHQPVIRQNKWASRVLIPVGKRTVVFTSDSLDSKGSTRVVVTATPIEQ